MNLYCKKCSSNLKIEEHHIQPRFMDNKKGWGLKVYLCKKCHTILHFTIPIIIWKYIDEKYKYKIIKEVEYFTNQYIKNNKDTKIIENKSPNRCKHCDRELDIEDIIKNICPYCFKTISNKINGDDDDKYY